MVAPTRVHSLRAARMPPHGLARFAGLGLISQAGRFDSGQVRSLLFSLSGRLDQRLARPPAAPETLIPTIDAPPKLFSQKPGFMKSLAPRK